MQPMSVEDRFLATAEGLGVRAEAQGVLRAAQRRHFLARVPSAIAKLPEPSPELVEAARRVLSAQDLPEPWIEEIALWSLLARDGRPRSIDLVLERAHREHPTLELAALAWETFVVFRSPGCEDAIAQLAAVRERALSRTEAVAWQERLGLGLKADWLVEIQIWDAPGDALTRPRGANTKINVSICPRTATDWKVLVSQAAGQMVVTSGATYQE